MGVIVSFDDFTPPPRYDVVSWSEARVEEAPVAGGPWTQIDVIALTPDADPTAPASRDFTTDEGTGDALWYRVVFADANGDTSQPTAPLQNVAGETIAAYASVAELCRILHIRQPTADQTVALQRVLASAAIEIDSELGSASPAPYPALVVEVNLERAVEHWQAQEAILGFVGVGAEAGPARISSDTWTKFANKLVPLKTEGWGLA